MRYAKLKEGSIFLYRQTKRSSKNGKFYFFGGGFVKEIIKIDSDGAVHAIVEDGFRLLQPVYEDHQKLEVIKWTSKNKRSGSWAYFWNQYGMNELSREEFLGILDDEMLIKVDVDEGKKAVIELAEEIEEIEKNAKRPEEFIGIYTKLGKEISSKKLKQTKARTPSARKVDFDSLNKTKKNRGTFGEILIYNDEVVKVNELKINNDVEHVAITQGDGLGYDILSYDINNAEIFIEVKTTTADKIDGFYLTPNELVVAKEKGQSYKLYRVYDLDMQNGTYKVEIFDGQELLDMFELKPVTFIANLK